MGRKGPKKKNSSALLWIIYGCSLLALATPLLISRVPSLPVTFIQTLSFQGLVELAFAAWLALAISDKRYRPKRNIVLIALAVFVAAALLSLLFVPDPAMSFWSRIWRMSGVWWLLHMFAWFLTLHSSLRSREDWRQFLGLSCIIAGIAFFIAFTRWLRVPTTTVMGGTLGNPSHMAAYLLPHVFIAAYLSVGSAGFTRKALITAMVAFSVGVLMTGSRGGAVALAFGLSLAFILLIASSGVRRRTKFIVLSATALLALIAIFGILALRSPAMRDWGGAHLPDFAQRLIYRDFGGDRWFLWEYALKGAAERPVFGWGNEGFAYLYDHFYDHESEARQVFYERWQDRAHNRYLDILVAYGAVGLAAYLFLWLSIFFVAVFRHVRSDDIRERKRGLILLTLLSTVAVYDVFMLETLAQAAVVFLVFGLVAASADGKQDDEDAPDSSPSRKAVAVSIVLISIVFTAVITLMPYIRALQFDEAGQKVASDPERAAEIFGIAFGWPNPYRNEMIYGAVYTALTLEADLPVADMEPLIRLLAEKSRRAADGAPLSTRETMMMSQVSRLLAYYDPTAAADARAYAERLRDMAPGKFDGYFELARIDLFDDAADEALRNLALAEERVYVPRKEFALLVEVHKAAAYAARGDYHSMFSSLVAASEGGYKLGDEPLPVIMMGRSVQAGVDVPDGLVKYASDIAGLKPTSLRTGLAAARIMALAGKGEEALALLDGLAEKRPDGTDEIDALREEIATIMSGYVEEETQ